MASSLEDQVLKDSNVAAVCVGMEEQASIWADSMLTAASFPWNDPSLLLLELSGNQTGTWDVREPEP